MKRDVRTAAERAAEMEAKGYLTFAEVWNWCRPHQCSFSDGLDVRRKGTRFYLDGSIKSAEGREVGRWFVRVGCHGLKDEGAKVKPNRVFDLPYLLRLRDRIREHVEGPIWDKYEKAAAACREALPEGGVIFCDPRPFDEGKMVSYTTVCVPSPTSYDIERGLSYGSKAFEESRKPNLHPLRKLGELGLLFKYEELVRQYGSIGSAAKALLDHRGQWWCKHGLVGGLIMGALSRYIPRPDNCRGVKRLQESPVVITVLDETFYFRPPVGWQDSDSNDFLPSGWKLAMRLNANQEVIRHEFPESE